MPKTYKRKLSEEELNEWNHALKGVRRNKVRATKSLDTLPDLEVQIRKHQDFFHISPEKIRITKALVIDDEEGSDKRTTKIMKRGKLEVNAKIDLHGFTEDQAFSAVKTFILSSFYSKKRNLLIITGKGSSITKSSVLRTKLPEWLNLEGIRERIIRFSSASNKHGGNGAFYVLLKKCHR